MYSLPECLLEEYELIEQVAQSLIADIFKLKKIKTNKFYALKIYNPSWVEKSRDSVDSFQTNLENYKNLSHPVLVKNILHGKDKERYFKISPFIEGTGLRNALRKKNVLNLPVSLVLVKDVAELLRYLVDNRILDRNIKFSNLLLEKKTMLVRLLGLNVNKYSRIAKKRTGSSDVLSQYGDIYFLGTLLFEVLTSRSPISRSGLLDTQWKEILAEEMMLRFPVLKPDQAYAFEIFLTRCFSREKANRFLSVAEFLRAYTFLLAKLEKTFKLPVFVSGANEIIQAMNSAVKHAGESHSYQGLLLDRKTAAQTMSAKNTITREKNLTPIPFKQRVEKKDSDLKKIVTQKLQDRIKHLKTPEKDTKSNNSKITDIQSVVKKQKGKINTVTVAGKTQLKNDRPVEKESKILKPNFPDQKENADFSLIWQENGENIFEKFLFKNLTGVIFIFLVFVFFLLRL
ncbi:protein kinase [Candidatus Riflebacteria bacterium]